MIPFPFVRWPGDYQEICLERSSVEEGRAVRVIWVRDE